MFFESRRGRRDTQSPPLYRPERPIRLDEVHLDAWALALDQRRETYGPMFRTDQPRGLFARLPRWIFRFRPEHVAQGVVRSGVAIEPDRGIGEAGTKPYVWLAEIESAADER